MIWRVKKDYKIVREQIYKNLSKFDQQKQKVEYQHLNMLKYQNDSKTNT